MSWCLFITWNKWIFVFLYNSHASGPHYNLQKVPFFLVWVQRYRLQVGLLKNHLAFPQCYVIWRWISISEVWIRSHVFVPVSLSPSFSSFPNFADELAGLSKYWTTVASDIWIPKNVTLGYDIKFVTISLLPSVTMLTAPFPLLWEKSWRFLRWRPASAGVTPSFFSSGNQGLIPYTLGES